MFGVKKGTGEEGHVSADVDCSADLAHALGLYEKGMLEDAEREFLHILSRCPDAADAHYFLGHIAHLKGDDKGALERLRKAAELKPDFAEAHNHVGNALRSLGEQNEALESYRKALAIRPDYAAACFNVATILSFRDEFDEASHLFERTLALDPTFKEARNGLGLIDMKRGDLTRAMSEFRTALEIDPDYVEALNNLAIALKDGGHPAEAVKLYDRALFHNPESAELHSNLGIALKETGKIDAAIAHFRRALELNSVYPEAYNNLAVAFKDIGRIHEAEECCRKALALRPDYPDALNTLGSVLSDLRQLDEAAECFNRALSLQPDFAVAWNNLGGVTLDKGNNEAAVSCYRRAVESFAPGSASVRAVAHSNMLLTMQYSSRYTPEEFYAESRRWESLHGSFPRMPFTNVPDVGRRLKVGYVSADFRLHSVSYFLKGIMGARQRDAVEVICYSDVLRPDDTTKFFTSNAELWRDIKGLGDEEVARLVVQDKIDILVDLGGHTGTRLGVFARRPAPVQVTWIGYPDTTGLSSISYRFTDNIADPPGETDRFHAEKLWRLPGGFLCYSPSANAPGVERSQSAAGRVIFGSFNSFSKVTPEIIALWSALLARVPGSRLMMKNKSMEDDATREYISALFSRHGVDQGRLELRPLEESTASHLSLYASVDISLDTFPYNGTTTTCESLWMGVPVLTLRGERHVARVGASILSRLGLDDLVAATPDEYLRIGETLARDAGRRSRLRSTLRETMLNSTLCDAASFASQLEEAYRQMWRKWCTGRLG